MQLALIKKPFQLLMGEGQTHRRQQNKARQQQELQKARKPEKLEEQQPLLQRVKEQGEAKPTQTSTPSRTSHGPVQQVHAFEVFDGKRNGLPEEVAGVESLDGEDRERRWS